MKRILQWMTAPVQLHRLFEPIFRISGHRKNQPATLLEARSILIIRPDHLGDAILTSAFLRELRRNWPAAEITLLVSPGTRLLVDKCPYINHIELYSRFQPCRFGRIRRFFREVNWARRHLWPKRFDLAVVPRWDTQIFREGVLAYLSGAKWRVGFSEQGNTLPRNEEESYELLYTHLAPSGPPDHEVQKTLDLLAFMGAAIAETHTEVWIDPEEREFARTVLPDLPDGQIRVVMVPGSSSASRRWPAERFGEIAVWMTANLGWEVVLVGTPDEIPLGRMVESACSRGIVNLIGRTTVPQTIAAIERCRLYVGNDTGPMHMASALKVPVIEISCHPVDGLPGHERSPWRFRPWDVPVWFAQPATGLDDCRGFCVRGEQGEVHCVLAISVEQVKALVLQAAEKCGLPIPDRADAPDFQPQRYRRELPL